MSGDGTIKAGLSLTQNSITARVRHVWQEISTQSLLHERTVLLRVGIHERDPPVAELVVLRRVSGISNAKALQSGDILS